MTISNNVLSFSIETRQAQHNLESKKWFMVNCVCIIDAFKLKQIFVVVVYAQIWLPGSVYNT
jgi:hypothetical protein